MKKYKLSCYKGRKLVFEELSDSYGQLLHIVNERKLLYTVITISEYDELNEKYFLHRIIK